MTAPDLPLTMPLDAPKVETVLRNLLDNALRYVSAGGAIDIVLSQANGFALLEVQDTGSGIHPDDLPHIFDRYFQSNQPDKSRQGGMGIGLALCREYCDLWGGSIRVSSELGKGSRFTVAYPIRDLQESGQSALISPVSDLPTPSGSGGGLYRLRW